MVLRLLPLNASHTVLQANYLYCYGTFSLLFWFLTCLWLLFVLYDARECFIWYVRKERSPSGFVINLILRKVQLSRQIKLGSDLSAFSLFPPPLLCLFFLSSYFSFTYVKCSIILLEETHLSNGYSSVSQGVSVGFQKNILVTYSSNIEDRKGWLLCLKGRLDPRNSLNR